MKNPWDEDDKTSVISKGELTERVSVVKPATVSSPSPKTTVEDPEDNNPTFETRSHSLTQISNFYGLDLGVILQRIAGLKPAQWDEAKQIKLDQGASEDSLGDILIRKKWVTQDQLLQAMSLQLNIPVLTSLGKVDVDSTLISRVPINFAKKFSLLPLTRRGLSIVVAIADGQSLAALDDLRLLLQANVLPQLAPKSDILDAINRAYNQASKNAENIKEDLMDDLEQQDLGSVNLNETQDLLDSEDEAPIIRLVNALLFQAVKDRASDIHIEPFEKDISVRFRIDGVMSEVMRPPKKAMNSISSRIKIMAELDIAERRIPQDGRIKIKIGGKEVDIRVSTLPTSYGERIVMRLLDSSSVILNLKDLGFEPHQLKVMHHIINLEHGIFLVTGPTGSGKSTTLYACLSAINSKELNIITVEDPVEIQLPGISQIQVNPKVNLTFAAGLRSILRQDPDVVMVGEIRDRETAEISIQASMTGHLVLSTLHTNDAATSITRLTDMGVESFKVSASLVGILAQRLARRLCKQCKTAYKPALAEIEKVGLTQEQVKNHTFYRPTGCVACGKTGYRGRTGLHELMPIDDDLRTLILKSSDANVLRKAAIDKGMKPLRDDGIEKILDGTTSIEEILRTTQVEMEFEI